jgi:hypothetical protein
MMNLTRYCLLFLAVTALGCASNSVTLQQECSGGDPSACEELARAQAAPPPPPMQGRYNSESAPVVAPMIQRP